MISKGYPSDLKTIILQKVTDLQLLYFYLQIESLPIVMTSPLRVDNNPSFGLFLSETNSIFYLDFATRDSGNIWVLLGKLWNYNHQNTLIKIYNDLPKIKKGAVSTEILSDTRIVHYKSNSNLNIAIRAWKDYDLEYWANFGINLDWLKFGQIYPISYIITENDYHKDVRRADKYAYVYLENKDNNISLKIYQPFNLLCKWLSKHDSSVWDLWAQLPNKGTHLIITSSRKDALAIWSNTGIPACSLQGETYLPKAHIIDELKNRFTNIYILYDNDFNKLKNWGQIASNRLATAFNLKEICIPTIHQQKDPSDFINKYGPNALKPLILKLINHDSN